MGPGSRKLASADAKLIQYGSLGVAYHRLHSIPGLLDTPMVRLKSWSMVSVPHIGWNNWNLRLHKKWLFNFQKWFVFVSKESISLIDILLTSQESFFPSSYPAQRNDSLTIFLCPDLVNMFWHFSFSMIGTLTWCKMLGTLPPDHTKVWLVVSCRYNFKL